MRGGTSCALHLLQPVLASTLRGVMASQKLGEEVDNRIVITHVDELRKQLADDLDTFRGCSERSALTRARTWPTTHSNS